jgi:circadian clock protein KaiC
MVNSKKNIDKDTVLDFIEEAVKQTNAKRLCIDSVTAIAYILEDKAKIREFIFDLGKILASLGCTTILTSEVTEENRFSVFGVEEFIADAILRLDQKRVKDELERVMQIIKVRGRAYKSEDLYFNISRDGVNIFPRLKSPLIYESTTERMSTGNAVLDEMLYGGLFVGSSSLIVGSTGTGKSLLSMQFINEGLKKGEPCLYAGFEESREQLIRNAKSFGWDFDEYEKKGLLVLRCVYPGEKFLEEHLADIKQIVESKGLKRCVVDSLSSISHSFQLDVFTDFAKRLNGYLKVQNVTNFFTSSTAAFMGAQTLTESHLSVMTDNIVMLRHVEVEGNLKLVLNIVKVRGSAHSKGLREYNITKDGVIIGQPLAGYEGIMTGVTRKVSETTEERLETEFQRFIGPMGEQVFSELKEKGLSKEGIHSYIDELAKDGIIKKQDAEMFKRNVVAILGASVSGEEIEKNKGKIEEAFSVGGRK